MVAHIPTGPEVWQPVSIQAVEFVDHIADKTSELGLHVVGDTPEQSSAVRVLAGPQLIEVIERDP